MSKSLRKSHGGATKSKVSRKGSKKSRKGSKKSRKSSKMGTGQAYCVKCKKAVNMVDGKDSTFKRKGGATGHMMKGKCATCGTKVNRIMASK